VKRISAWHTTTKEKSYSKRPSFIKDTRSKLGSFVKLLSSTQVIQGIAAKEESLIIIYFCGRRSAAAAAKKNL